MAYELDTRVPVDRYPEPVLRSFAQALWQALGASEEEAAIIADGLLTASLWWHPGQGQGLEKFFRDRRQIRAGGIVPRAPMRWLVDRPSYALLDAAKGFGYVAASRAMRKAIGLARSSGIAMVGVRNSNHFGIAGYHALQAANAGLIGWAMTNARAEMAPWGSAEPVLGTNPWGIAVPRQGQPPIVLDMALTMSGKGMMRWLQRAGLPMPDNWALTPDGKRTTDPAAAMDGPVLPIGEYKGYGLSLISDVLAGVMTGALFGRSVFQDEQHFGVGHLMLAIDPAALGPREAFDQRLEQLIAEVLAAPPIDDQRPVVLPGEVEQRRAEERRRDGIPIDSTTVEQLRSYAAEYGVACPL